MEWCLSMCVRARVMSTKWGRSMRAPHKIDSNEFCSPSRRKLNLPPIPRVELSSTSNLIEKHSYVISAIAEAVHFASAPFSCSLTHFWWPSLPSIVRKLGIHIHRCLRRCVSCVRLTALSCEDKQNGRCDSMSITAEAKQLEPHQCDGNRIVCAVALAITLNRIVLCRLEKLCSVQTKSSRIQWQTKHWNIRNQIRHRVRLHAAQKGSWPTIWIILHEMKLNVMNGKIRNSIKWISCTLSMFVWHRLSHEIAWLVPQLSVCFHHLLSRSLCMANDKSLEAATSPTVERGRTAQKEMLPNSPKNVEQIYSDIWFPDLLDSLKCDSSLFSIRLNCNGKVNKTETEKIKHQTRFGGARSNWSGNITVRKY